MKRYALGIATLSAALALGTMPAIARTNCTQNSISGDWLLTLTVSNSEGRRSTLGADDSGREAMFLRPDGPQTYLLYCDATIARSGVAEARCYDEPAGRSYTTEGQIGVTRGCVLNGSLGAKDGEMTLSGRFSSTPGSWPTLVTGIGMMENLASSIDMDIVSISGIRLPWNLDLDLTIEDD